MQLAQSKVGQDVMKKPGQMGLCVRVYPFPEDCRIVWIMLSVQFKR